MDNVRPLLPLGSATPQCMPCPACQGVGTLVASVLAIASEALYVIERELRGWLVSLLCGCYL